LKKSEANPTERERFSRFLDYHKPMEHHSLRARVPETPIPKKGKRKNEKNRVFKQKNQRKMGSELSFLLAFFLLGLDQSVA
jgi:hypothetical protein